MSEYMEGHAVSRLFGSPPGYVGHNEGGQLTEAVKRNPYSIILYDEVEKAHPRIFDALLQVLDAGRMTDGQGNIVDFKNTIIIMTSNIGSSIIKDGLIHDRSSKAIEKELMIEAGKHFRPEFLNRFDAKVMFNALDLRAIVKVAEAELEKLAGKLLTDNHLDLQWHPNIPKMITKKAYNLVDGARPIKRYINDGIVSMLTEGLLSGEIKAGNIIYIPWTKSKWKLQFQVVDKEQLQALNDEAKEEMDLNLKKIKIKKAKGSKSKDKASPDIISINTEMED
jgi:ATP-dependent Clp protease ATP-binding subunit ClpB